MPEAPRTEDTVTLRIKFKSETLEKFIERYAVDVSPGGIFIRTREPLGVGTAIDFEFTLGDGTSLLAGLGTVVWVRETDASRTAAPGMGLRFDKLRPAAQAMLSKILAEKARREKEGVGPVPSSRPSLPQIETIRDPESGPRTRTPARGIVPRVAPPVVADLDSTVSLSTSDLMDGRLLPQTVDAWENESEKTEIAALPPSFYYEKADAAVADRGRAPAPAPREDEDITHPRLQMPAASPNRAPTPAVGSPMDRPGRLSGARPVIEAGAMQTARRAPASAGMPTPAPLPVVTGRPNPAFNRTMMGMPAANSRGGGGRIPTPPPLPVQGAGFRSPTPPPSMPAVNFGRIPTPAPLPIVGAAIPGGYARLPTPAPMPIPGVPRLPTPYPMPQAGQPRVSASYGVQGGLPGAYGQPVQNGFSGYGNAGHENVGYGNAGFATGALDGAPSTEVGPRRFGKGKGVLIVGLLLGAGAAAAGLFLGPQLMELVGGKSRDLPREPMAERLDPKPVVATPSAATVTPLPAPESATPQPPAAEPTPEPVAVVAEKPPSAEPPAPPHRGGRSRSTPRARATESPRAPRPAPESPPEPAPVAAAPAAPAAPSENDVYWLAIRSTPPGAEVLIDGETEGKTPFDRRILDPSRTYAITVRKDGFESFAQKLSGADSDWHRKGSELRLVVNAKLKHGAGETASEKAPTAAKKDNPFDSDK